METTHLINLPEGPVNLKGPLLPGDIRRLWCSRHAGENPRIKGRQTRHLYRATEYPALVCLECHPEFDPEKGETK